MKFLATPLLIASLLIPVLLLVSCNKSNQEIKKVDPKFSTYISSFTSGIISKQSKIRLRLMSNVVNDIDYEKPIEKELFEIKPEIKGKAYWINNQTIEFRPETNLTPGVLYDIKFNLAEIQDVPKDMEKFEFQVQTIQTDFEVEIEYLNPYTTTDLLWNKLTGKIVTSDFMTGHEVVMILASNQMNKPLPVTWTHNDNGKYHYFTVDSVLRKETEGELKIKWNGKSINVDKKGERVIQIPSLNDFKLMNIRVNQQPNQYVTLEFSDPLDKNQDLTGLIDLSGTNSPKFEIEKNIIKVYPSKRLAGTRKLKVFKGIKNVSGGKLFESYNNSLSFEEIKPDVRYIGKGVILPSKDGLTLPFEAVNLEAVDVRVIKIFEDNIAQFFQTNRLDGANQLHRVGRLIKKQKVQLVTDKIIDYGLWNTFALDLSELIKVEPGAIYRVELSFRKSYSLYGCGDVDEEDDSEDLEYLDDQEVEQTIWDVYYNYNRYNNRYDYSQKDNPCHISYYIRHRGISKNILGSNIGLIAKGGEDKTLKVMVNSLITTEPLSSVTVEAYNYQSQLIASGTSNSKGMSSLNLTAKPYLLVAKSGNERGYLKLDDGSALSLSKFDVSGKRVQKGIKGFIYGERGVWRPGDTIFLNFILEDENHVLPENHPVVFELTNPQGQLVKRKVKTGGLNGFYNFTTITKPEAPTGYWTAKVKVGGTSFTKQLKIETVKPNRLKIDIDFGEERIYKSDKKLNGCLKVAWLHGAPARKLRTEVKVTLQQTHTNFKTHTDYVFDDPVRRFTSEEQTVFDDDVDEKGDATISNSINLNDEAPGMLKANFVTRAFEEGGDFSIDRFSIEYVPYETFVGIKLPKGDAIRGMLLTDTSQTIKVVTLSDKGEKVQVDSLTATIYKINWRWWWDASRDNLAYYISRTSHAPVVKQTISTNSKGEGEFEFKVKYPSWGRYLVRICDNAGGHCTGKTVYIDWPGWAGRAQRENPGGASMLTFATDKKKYLVGETAEITIPTGGIGRALVSIENGSTVIDAYWVTTEKKSTKVKIPVTADMAPNVFVNITLVQPHSKTENDLPIRMYGVMPLMVEDPNTKIQPLIDMPDELRPEESFTLKVKEKTGKAMTYTVAIVDEGLLSLTRFKTPNPHHSFYAREALGVKSWDLYSMVIGAYGGKIQGLYAIGGGAGDKVNPESSKANRFKPVVKFLGPFELKAGEKATHKIDMPNYIGAVRAMVIAGQNNAYGAAEKSVQVKKPLMVLATLPRVLGPEETVKLPVTVFAMKPNIKNVTIEIITNDLLVSENKMQTIEFESIGDKIVNFDIKVEPKLGIGRVKIIASSGNEKATYDIELDVRNPNPPITKFIDTILVPGATLRSTYAGIGIEGTNSGSIELSSIPPIDFSGRMRGLIRYPHGCVEQTTSKAIPQLFLADVVELNDQLKKELEHNVKAAINKLINFQQTTGGFGYWPGDLRVNDWGTSYAGHFLIEAEKRGFDLPYGMIKNWIKHQKRVASNWSNNSNTKMGHYQVRYDLIQAYRLFTLALANEPDIGAMNRLRESNNLNSEAKWRLAAAYALVGQPQAASDLIKGLSTEVLPYDGQWYSYGSNIRDMAMILESLVYMGKKSKGLSIIKTIATQLNDGRWLSTQTTAFSLLAVSKFMSASTYSEDLNFSLQLNNETKENVLTNKPVLQVPLDFSKKQSGTYELVNNNESPLFIRISLEGQPTIGNMPDEDSNLRMDVVYKDLKGNEIDVYELQQGVDFLAEVSISNPGTVSYYYTDMALTQIFPSGWEIHNTRMDGFQSVHQESVPDYQDIRDDRVYTYFNIRRYNTQKYTVILNAAYVGKFYLPGVKCEAMYNDRIKSTKSGKWVKVVVPGEL